MSRSRWGYVTDLLVAYKWPLVAVALLVTLWVTQTNAAIQAPEIPRPALVGITAVIMSALAGYIPSVKLVRWLYSPNNRYLVDLDTDDDGFALWELSPSAWDNLAVEEGELHKLPNTKSPAYTCQGFDPETNAAEGTWRGSASDLEMLREKERIAEIRGQLETMAQRGISLRMRSGSIVRQALSQIVTDLVAQYEGITIPHGERVEQAVEDALDDYDLLGEADDVADDQDGQPSVTVNVGGEGEAAVAGGGDGDE